MPIPLNVQNAIDDLKQQDPSLASYSDEALYKHLKRTDISLAWDDVDSGGGSEPNTSPTFMNAFQEWFDYGIDENSYGWMKSAYNNSLTGLTEQLVTGKQRYDIKDYDPNILEDIGSMALSFTMPLDIIAMAAGGGAGGLAAKAVGIRSAKKLAELEIKRGLGETIAESAIRQASTLATYEGAIGGVQAGINDEDVMSGIAGGAFHGAVLGGLAGAAGGGLAWKHADLLSKYESAGAIARAGKEATKELTGAEKWKLRFTGIPGQIASESGVFTAAEQAERIAHGEDVRLEDVLVSYGKNIGLFTLLKGQSKLLSKSKEHYELLKEAEKNKFDLDAEGKMREDTFASGADRLYKEAEVKERNGDIEGAEIDRSAADILNRERKGITEEQLRTQSELDKAGQRIDTLIEDVNAGVTEGSVKRAKNIILGVNEQITITEKLIERATDTTRPVFQGQLGSFKKHLTALEALADKWSGVKKDSLKKEFVSDKPTILKESKELGVDIEGIDLSKREGRAEATKQIEARKDVLLERERKKITPLTAEGEAVDILATEAFKGKDWSAQVPDPKMRKDVETRIEGTDKQKGLAEVDANIVADTGGFKGGSKESVKYNSSKNIVRHFIQNIFPTQIGKTVRKGALVGNPAQKANRLNTFAKWMAEKGKEFKEVTNENYQIYLSQKPSHVTELQQLREFLQTNQISSKSFNLTRDMTKAFAKKYVGESPEGLTLDAHSIGKNTITYAQPKTNQPITKYISNKLQGILTKLKKAVGLKAPDTNQHFITKDGRAISHDVLNTFVDNTFGAKGLKDRARLFRDSLTGWASEKFGSTSPKVEVLIQEVLGDKANVSTINKAYVSKEAQSTGAKKLVKQFIAEINKGGKKAKGKDFYSTKEIANGLKKLKGKKDVTLLIKVGTKKGKDVYKEVSIDAMTAEGMARYLIETSPRLNEVVPSGVIKYQLESAASRLGITVGELNKQVDYFKKKYPELDIKLKEDLGKFQGEYVLGRVTGHLVDIAKGRAKADTIPHEVSHHVVDILRAFGDKGSKKLIKDGERMFKSVDKTKSGEENMVQSIGEYVAGRLKNKTMVSKVKNFLQKFWSHLKHKLNIHNEADVTRILGEKVIKGKLPEGRLKEFNTKFQTSKDSKEARDQIKVINERIHAGFNDSLIARVKNADVDGHRKARLEFFGTEKYKTKDVTVEDMRRYEEYLVSHPANYGNKRSSEPIARKIEEINEKYHVSPETAKADLKLMGVKDGLYENASPETAKAYESFVRTHYEAPHTAETSFTSLLALEKEKFPLFPKYARAIMPVWLVLKNYGGKPGKAISKRLLDHEWVEHVLYKGHGDQAIYLMKKTLGKNSKYIHLFDKERAKRNYEAGDLTKGEKDFYEKIYGDKADKNSNEYKAHQVWDNLSEFYWKSLEKELTRHETPEGAKRIMAGLNQLRVNGYMTRRLSKKAIEYVTKDSNYITDLVQKNQDRVAANRAKELGKTDTERKLIEKRLKKDKELREEIRTELYDAITFGYTNVKNPNLIPRTGLLKEYVTITNKNGRLEKIKVYEDSIDATAETYVRRMSKYLASVRLFPEWTGVGSKFKIDTSKRASVEAMEKDASLGGYAKLAIKRQLGLDRSEQIALAQPIYKGMGMAANVSAAIGLSSPLSGLKNLMIGIPRSIGDFGFFNTMRGIKHTFNSLAWHEARKKGYLEYGSKSLELGTIGVGGKLTMANMFKYVNLMTGTENINRIASSHAGHLYFTQALATLRGEKGMFKMGSNKKRMKRLMEELWHLDEGEISFLEKTKDFTTKESMQKHAEILNKVGHFSHVSSQGGTSAVILPLWMSSSEARPMTLFQRMATATTIDSYRNFVKPIAEFGNFAPLVRAAVAHSVSGAALYFVYKELFGKEPPVGSKLTQEDSFDKIMMNLWRSEFLGMFGEIISPYDRAMAVPMADPVVIRNLREALNEYTMWNGGGKTAGQAVKDWVKKSVVVVNQVDMLYKTSKEPYYKDFMSLRSMVRKFKQEREMPVFSGDGNISRRQPFYRDLKDAMMFGSEEDVAKTYWAAIDGIVSQEEVINPHIYPHRRIKKAKQAVKSVITHFNPLNISDEIKGTEKSLLDQFYTWLSPENKRLAQKVKKQYEYKHRNYLRIIYNPKWKNLYSVYPYI